MALSHITLFFAPSSQKADGTSEVKVENYVFALYFSRFALSFQNIGGTSEVKVENYVFALYFSRFALSLKRIIKKVVSD